MEKKEKGILAGILAFFGIIIAKLLKKPKVVIETPKPTPPPQPTTECKCYKIVNTTLDVLYYEYMDCGFGHQMLPLGPEQATFVCSSNFPSGVGLNILECENVCTQANECNC